MSARDVLQAAALELSADRRIAVCAIVAARGSVPQPAGTIVCVSEAFHMVGTIGGGCVESEIRSRAFALLSRLASAVKSNDSRGSRGELLTLRLDHDFGHDDGMICGGEIDVAVNVWRGVDQCHVVQRACRDLHVGDGTSVTMCVESAAGWVEYRVRVEAAPQLIIVGGGHIGRVLAQITVPLGFEMTVLDDRSEFACSQRFPAPIRTVVGSIGPTLRGWPMGRHTYIVIVTRGHRHDEEALAAVLTSPAKYIGMIGSRRKVQIVFDDLRHAGASEDQLARVHAPIGVDIGAVTTEEIALSIAAQLVRVRRADCHEPVEGPFPLPAAPAQ